MARFDDPMRSFFKNDHVDAYDHRKTFIVRNWEAYEQGRHIAGSIIKGLDDGLKNLEVTIPEIKATLPSIKSTLPKDMFQNARGASGPLPNWPEVSPSQALKLAGLTMAPVSFHHLLKAATLDSQLTRHKKMWESLASQNLYGLFGIAAVGGMFWVRGKSIEANAGKRTADANIRLAQAKALQAAKEAKAKIKQAKAEAKASVKAEKKKIAARVKEISQKLEERVKHNIQEINMDRDYSFDDIYGQDDAIRQAKSFLLRVTEFDKLQRLQEGVPGRTFLPTLMTGPPGTGKTETIRAIVSEARRQDVKIKAYILSLNHVEEELAAHTVETLRKIVDENKEKNIKTLLFMDEVDSIQYKPQLNNEILTLMDGVKPFDALVMAGTNRPETLSAAILSRFPESIPFQSADSATRKQILKSKLEQYQLSEQSEETLLKLSEQMEGFNGRDIKDVVEIVRKERVDEALADKSIAADSTDELPCTPEELEKAIERMKFKVSMVDSRFFTADNILQRRQALNGSKATK